MILALETSCDETAAAVVDAEGNLLGSVVASQAELHAPYGGVVPEVASRRHLELAVPVVEEALRRAGVGLDAIEAVAVTEGPGLIGALLVGLATAKAIAFGRHLPLIPVDHLLGHVLASTLGDDPIEPPFLCLVASGGHTFIARVDEPPSYEVLGQTLDDAAGEAFDKGARLLGLGYPGGPALERAAADGDPEAVPFPVAMLGRPGHDFSFSGLKTALLQAVRDAGEQPPVADLAASYQRASVRSLVGRAGEALDATGHTTLAVVGGVAANGELRAAFEAACAQRGVELALAPLELCSDNAAMIASAARFSPAIPYPEYLARDAYATVV